MREKAIKQNQMLSSGSKMFVSWRMNGKLCNKALQQLRHLRINAVQNGAFALNSPLKHRRFKINFPGLNKSEKALDQI
ncbi:hypothetical protein KY290_033064 [Solanum tuberosum]|uniref:Uncharacterized protein n=1 Tax=Solanum tuberosum TaxID=4113 RepID=A0ABQ7TZ66_SOLTU|nr:hypothetical protein KY285_032313 [Solanum tuberosum]KAH0740021.1 hypothetical protein KY290_033064 [Solanum tuberosum]